MSKKDLIQALKQELEDLNYQMIESTEETYKDLLYRAEEIELELEHLEGVRYE